MLNKPGEDAGWNDSTEVPDHAVAEEAVGILQELYGRMVGCSRQSVHNVTLSVAVASCSLFTVGAAIGAKTEALSRTIDRGLSSNCPIVL
jgi:hypothetical protein